MTRPLSEKGRSFPENIAGERGGPSVIAHLTPKVVWMSVVIPTVVKMVPMSWLMVSWSRPTHMASASKKGTATVPLKQVR